jgi:hypothetical protein
MRELLVDNDRWYTLLENDNGQLVLQVVCGGAFMFEREVVLSEEQLSDYKRLGKSYLDTLALRVAKGWE